MAIVKFDDLQQEAHGDCVYVILGIDEDACDRVLAVRKTFEEAKIFMTKIRSHLEFYDLWVETFPLK
jgi:hypothetical protein